MFGGGRGGLDPSKMQKMMKQMGIDIDELDAEEVIIRTSDEELVFTDAEVQRMDAQGQATYNVVGEPERRDRGESELAAGTDADAEDAAGTDADAEDADDGIPQDDIDIVSQRTGAREDKAREALEATDGDLAAAVERLE